MKTKKIKKLTLGKNTIVNLNARLMGDVMGGGVTDTCTCTTCPPAPSAPFTKCATNCPECPPPTVTADTFEITTCM